MEVPAQVLFSFFSSGISGAIAFAVALGVGFYVAHLIARRTARFSRSMRTLSFIGRLTGVLVTTVSGVVVLVLAGPLLVPLAKLVGGIVGGVPAQTESGVDRTLSSSYLWGGGYVSGVVGSWIGGTVAVSLVPYLHSWGVLGTLYPYAFGAIVGMCTGYLGRAFQSVNCYSSTQFRVTLGLFVGTIAYIGVYEFTKTMGTLAWYERVLGVEQHTVTPISAVLGTTSIALIFLTVVVGIPFYLNRLYKRSGWVFPTSIVYNSAGTAGVSSAILLPLSIVLISLVALPTTFQSETFVAVVVLIMPLVGLGLGLTLGVRDPQGVVTVDIVTGSEEPRIFQPYNSTLFAFASSMGVALTLNFIVFLVAFTPIVAPWAVGEDRGALLLAAILSLLPIAMAFAVSLVRVKTKPR